MSFKMNPVTTKVRIGVDKQSRLHVETWPMEHGWTRDIDPAISSSDPETIILDVETQGGIRRFLNKNDSEFQRLLGAISDILDLWYDCKEAEDDYSAGYLDALTEVGRIAQTAIAQSNTGSGGEV